MALFKDLQCRTSIDKYYTSTILNIGEISHPKQMGDYEFDTSYPLWTIHCEDKEKNKPCKYYETLSIYYHSGSDNRATICHQRKPSGIKHIIPSCMINFESSWFHRLNYVDVEKAIQSLEKLWGAGFRTSEIHLAIDFINPQSINLTQRINYRLKPGKKRTCRDFNTTRYHGAPRSHNLLTTYDKTAQLLEEKRIRISEDVCRIECKMKMKGLNNFITSIEDTGKHDWSWLYGRHFSFHYPNPKLIIMVGKKAKKMTIWELRDYMKKHYGVTSSNFYRDYLKEHRWLSNITKKALTDYRWNPNTKKGK